MFTICIYLFIILDQIRRDLMKHVQIFTKKTRSQKVDLLWLTHQSTSSSCRLLAFGGSCQMDHADPHSVHQARATVNLISTILIFFHHFLGQTGNIHPFGKPKQ